MQPMAGGWQRLQVRDKGVGIRPEDVSRLFVEFQQLDSSAIRLHQGTGLGLALIRKMVELHDGRVSVESRPAEGSTFTVEWPVTAEAAQRAKARPRAEGAGA